MKPSRTLAALARSRQRARRMNEMDRVVREVVSPTPGVPETFYATSGQSTIERAGVPWMPHDYKPTVGFRPNI